MVFVDEADDAHPRRGESGRMIPRCWRLWPIRQTHMATTANDCLYRRREGGVLRG